MNFIQQNEQWITKAQQVFDIQQRRKLLESQEDILITELKELTGGLNSVGGGFKYEAIVRAGTVNYKDIPQLKGVNLDIYRKDPVTTWKLTYVGSITEEIK
jgi:hypothetical protein